MASKIENLALLALVDERLDELKEDYGDLPAKVREKEKKAEEKQATVDETKSLIEEIKTFCQQSKVTLVELKDKEEKLSKQQFKVRNNKEFDAVTKEIEHIRTEHHNLTDKLRTEGIKEENLKTILEEQEQELKEAQEDLEEARAEFENVATDQNEELNALKKKREDISSQIEPALREEYERIRTFHADPVVKVVRNSCSGCFSAVPPQKIVEIRNNFDHVFFCESCGRMLYPEEINIDESIVEVF